MNKKIPLIFAIIILVVAAGVVAWLLWTLQTTDETTIQDAPTTSEQPDNLNEPIEAIIITTPIPNAVVTSPLAVTGFVQGTWMFEGTLPIELLDANGQLVSPSFGTANGDWMTENLIPFNARIEFTAPTTTTGWLAVRANNPSGLPENDDQFRIPVRFE